MPVNVTCACGAAYNLKDEYAGSQLSCPKCGAVITVPALPPAPPVHAQTGDPAFARDKFLLNQKHFAIREKYAVAGEDGAALMYVERPRHFFVNMLAIFGGLTAGFVNYLVFGFMAQAITTNTKSLPLALLLLLLYLWIIFGSFFVIFVASMALSRKRHVTVYRDESKEEVLLSVLQDRKIQLLSAWYTVTDPQGNVVAKLGKKYLHNIFRKRWYCRGADGALLFIAKEDSIILSILRRFLGSFFGLLRTNFIIYDRSENMLGEFNRRMTLLDRYILDMTADPLRAVDRRLALALGVMLDTGEKR
ncbi:MAG: zinc-ribbon domain-containing protein [Elusimicrobia bacterium]|nr:zinc-ribbon domain-containing protein [Elusimicrobiota bacterium]